MSDINEEKNEISGESIVVSDVDIPDRPNITVEEAEIPIEDGDSNASASENDGEESSGGLFSKLLKNRQARMDAVGSDDDYDIFDLQELMDISPDDEVFGEEKKEEAHAEIEETPIAEDEAPEEKSDKKHSFFSKFKRSKGEKDGSIENDSEEGEESENDPAPAEEPEEIPEEEAPEEEYVNPLDEMESFDKETERALSSINEMLSSSGMSEIDSEALNLDSAERIEREIEEKFDEEAPAGEEEKTKLAPNTVREETPEEPEEASAQLQIEDYDAESVEPLIVNEREEEEKLQSKRKTLVEKFKLTAKIGEEDPKYVEEKTEGTADIVEDVEMREGEGVFDAVERTAKEKPSFIEALKQRIEKKNEEENLVSITEVVNQLSKDKKRNFISIIAEAVIGAALLVFAIIGSTFDEGESVGGLFAAGGRIFVTINILLYAVGCVFALPSFKKAIERIRRGTIDSRAVWLCLNTVVFVQMIVALCTGLNGNSGFVLYAFAGAVSIIGELVSTKINLDSLSQTLSVLKKNELESIQPIERKEESAVLGYDLAENGDPSIYYSVPVKVPENIAYLSENTSKEQKESIISMLVPAAFGLVLTVVVCILRMSAMPLVTVFPCMICLALPIFRPLVLSIFKAEANKGSIVNGVSVLSYDDCDEVASANAVVIDANELMGANVSDFRRFSGAKMSKTDAAIYTAAVLKASSSMLSSCFDSFIENSGIDLPAAEDFEEEQDLCFTAWVEGVKVIVGTRRCIEYRSIPCPTEEQEKEYCGDSYVMYTCVEGRIVSTFKVTYLPRRTARKQIDALRKSGIVVMLNCDEPSLNEEAVSELLHCSAAMIKIISSNGRQVIKSNRERLTNPENNGIFSTKKKRSILLAVAEAYKLSQHRTMSKNVGVVLMALLVAVYFICGVLRFVIAFNPITVVLFSAIASAISFGIGKLADR